MIEKTILAVALVLGLSGCEHWDPRWDAMIIGVLATGAAHAYRYGRSGYVVSAGNRTDYYGPNGEWTTVIQPKRGRIVR